MRRIPFHTAFCSHTIHLWLSMTLMMVFFANGAQAVTRSWDGSIDRIWNEPNNWTASGVPNQTDDVVITPFVSGLTNTPLINISTNALVNSVTLQSPTGSTNPGVLDIQSGLLSTSADLSIGVSSTSKGTLTVVGNGTVAIGGQLVVEQGSVLNNNWGTVSQLNSSALVVRGTYNQIVASGADTIVNDLSIEATGMFDHAMGDVQVNDTLAIGGGNGAEYKLSNGGSLDVTNLDIGDTGSGMFRLLGTGQLVMGASDRLTINALGTFEIDHDYTFNHIIILNDGAVKLENTGTSKILTIQPNGSLRGSGEVQGDVINNWRIIPGTSGTVGEIDITSDFQQGTSAQLRVDLEGTGAGQFDQVNVTGDVILDGLVVPRFAAGFTPVAGSTFDLITTSTGSFFGTLPSVIPIIPTGVFDMDLSTQIDPTGQIMQLLIDIVIWDGDLNSDGFVGLDDLDIVLNNWNQTVTAGDRLSGDPTGDGFVGLDDLDVVLNQWNYGTPPPPLADASVVPEPNTTMVLILTTAGLAMRRLRQIKTFNPRQTYDR